MVRSYALAFGGRASDGVCRSLSSAGRASIEMRVSNSTEEVRKTTPCLVSNEVLHPFINYFAVFN